MIDLYKGIAPAGDVALLKRLGDKLEGKRFLHINSTKEGGGVADFVDRDVAANWGLFGVKRQ